MVLIDRTAYFRAIIGKLGNGVSFCSTDAGDGFVVMNRGVKVCTLKDDEINGKTAGEVLEMVAPATKAQTKAAPKKRVSQPRKQDKTDRPDPPILTAPKTEKPKQEVTGE